MERKPAKHFLWQAACGCPDVKRVCLPFALPFVLGRTGLKPLTVLAVVSSACPGSKRARLPSWAQLQQIRGWWQDPGQLRESSHVLVHVLPSEGGKLPSCSRSIHGIAICFLWMKMNAWSVPTHSSGVDYGYFNWHSQRCLDPVNPHANTRRYYSLWFFECVCQCNKGLQRTPWWLPSLCHCVILRH